MIKDLLFPKNCLVCGRFGTFLCLTCEKKLSPIKNNCCLYCGKISNLGLTHQSCKRKNGIDGLLSMYSYNPALKAIIRSIKYRGMYDAFHEVFLSSSELSVIKYFKFKRKHKDAVLQAIPLHKAKHLKRGFNQSMYIAQFIQWMIGYKTEDLLIRNKDTSAQAQMKDRRSRSENILDAFSIKNHMQLPSTVILVDDVVTTGSTVGEAAKTLKEGGVQKVFVFSLARD